MKNQVFKKILAFTVLVSIVSATPISIVDNTIRKNTVLADPISDANTSIQSTINNIFNGKDAAFTLKEFVGDLLRASLQELAKAALREMTTSTVNWINSGFEGKPLYFDNPKSFYISIRDQQVQTFIDEIGYDAIKYPFGEDYAFGLIDSVQRTFEDNARYSLDEAIQATQPGKTAEDFYEDFNVGGWDAFLSMATIPANNPVGFEYIAQQEIEERTEGTEQSQAEIIKQKVEQGLGFLSPQECTAEGYVGEEEAPFTYEEFVPPVDSDAVWDETYNDVYNEYIVFNGPEYEGTDDFLDITTIEGFAIDAANNAANAAEAENDTAQTTYMQEKGEALEEFNTAHTCPEDKWVDRTPGYVVASQITDALGSNFRQSELGAAVGSSLSAVFDALLNELFDQGLSALSGGEAPSNDNWNYQGLTLGGSESDDTVIGGSSWMNTADIVVDLQARLIGGGKKKTDIELTSEEITMYREILSQIQLLPEKMMTLDACVPGMNYDWKKRADKAFDRETQKLVRKANGNDGLFSEPEKADAALKTLEGDYALAKLNMQLRLLDNNIPSAQIMNDLIASLTGTKFKSATYYEFLIDKSSTLARLNSMKEKLLAGVPEEELIPQYIALQGKISTDSSLQSAQLDLDTIKDTLTEVGDMTIDCATEKNNLATTDPALYNILTGEGVWLDLSNALFDYEAEYITAEQNYYCQELLADVNQNNVYKNVDVIISCSDFYAGSLAEYYVDYAN